MACSLRVLSEFPNSPATLFIGNGTSVTTPPGSASGYVSWDCASTVSVGVAPYERAPVPALTAKGGDAFSILVTEASGGGGVSVAGFADATAPLADVGDNIDGATVRVVNARGARAAIFGVADECFGCALPELVSGGVGARAAAAPFRVDTAYGLTLRVDGGDALALGPFAEHGAYTLVLHADGAAPSLLVDAAGRDAYLPILYAAALLVAAAALHRILLCFVRRQARKGPRVVGGAGGGAREKAPRRAVTLASVFALDSAALEARAAARRGDGGGGGVDDEGSDYALAAPGLGAALLSIQEGGGGSGTADSGDGAGAGAESAARTRPLSAERVHSLDTFRGIALCTMMFVNSGGGAYAFFDHARWNGLTVADLVFPWFVFMSGVSAALSFASERKRGATARGLAARAVSRAVKLYLLNFLVNNDNDFSKFRAYGVLFYFSLSYLVIGLVDALLPPSTTRASDAPIPSQSLVASLYLDFGRYYKQWAVMAALWGVYLGVQFRLPVPGCPTGYIGPGGLADGGAFPGCTAGAHKYVDDLFVGATHYYGRPTCSGPDGVYGCGPYDPEGLLGGLSAAWMAWLGLNTGRIFLRQRAMRGAAAATAASAADLAAATTRRWAALGAALCLLAGLLCGFKKEGGWLPVNKNLWSPSFVLLLAGFGNLALSALYWLVDVRRAWDGTPFRFVGQNSLAVYLTSELLSDQVPLQMYWREGGPANHTEALLRDLTCVLVLLALARVWHIQKWFWSV
jgi:predicted acyltransferase